MRFGFILGLFGFLLLIIGFFGVAVIIVRFWFSMIRLFLRILFKEEG